MNRQHLAKGETGSDGKKAPNDKLSDEETSAVKTEQTVRIEMKKPKRRFYDATTDQQTQIQCDVSKF